MKKLINDPDAVVQEALEGIEAAHGDRVRVSYDPAYIVRADAPVQGKVGIISGGGSGHEPMHGGFVGPGMLDAACPGEVFTSPTPDQMLEATKAVDGGAGVLHIVKNYTGDVMNFEMAADLGKARGHRGRGGRHERRRRGAGLALHGRAGAASASPCCVEKIAGGAARGGQLARRGRRARRRVNAKGRTMGMALTPCITPGAGEPELRARRRRDGDRHRHPRRAGPLPRADRAGVADRRAARDADRRGPAVRVGRRVLAFVNGMGGTPLIELYVVYGELARLARGPRHRDRAQPVGNYITSLEMEGCSITLLQARRRDDPLWDAPVDTPALRWGA